MRLNAFQCQAFQPQLNGLSSNGHRAFAALDGPAKLRTPLPRSNDKHNLREGTDDGKVGDHVDLVELLVDHEAKDAQHGGTAVVELDAALEDLGLLIEGVPAEVEGAIAEIAGELGLAGDVLHDEELKDANEGDDLEKAGLGDGAGSVDGRKTVGEGIEGVSGGVDAARKVDASAGGDLAKEGLLYEIDGKQEAIRT